MDSLPGSAFSRRSDRNGTIVSACDMCLAAVAVSRREAELEKAERTHACDPETLDHWKMFLAEVERHDRNPPRGRKRVRFLPQRGDFIHAQTAGQPSSSLESKIEVLRGDVDRFRYHSARGREIHRARRSGLLLTSAAFILLATIAGISDLDADLQGLAGPVAAVFSLLCGATIGALILFRCSEQAEYYGRAVTICDELAQKLVHHVKTDREFDLLLAELYALRKLEGNSSQSDEKARRIPWRR